MDFANAFALTGWFVVWYLGGIAYSFANAFLLLKDGIFAGVSWALYGFAAVASLPSAFMLARKGMRSRLAAVVLPLAATFGFVFAASLLAGNGHWNVPAMEPEGIHRVDTIAGAVEIVALAVLAWLMRPQWAAAAALALFCATVWLSAMSFTAVLLSHQQM
jgi:hypothetical protein